MTGFTLKSPSPRNDTTHCQSREQVRGYCLTSPSETTLASSTISVSDKLVDSDEHSEQQHHQPQAEPRRQRSKSRSPSSSYGIFSFMKKRNSSSVQDAASRREPLLTRRGVDVECDASSQNLVGDSLAYTTASEQSASTDTQAALTDLMSKYGPGGFIPTPVVAEKPRSPVGQSKKSKNKKNNKSPSPPATHLNTRQNCELKALRNEARAVYGSLG